MHRADKEAAVADLVEQLRDAESLIVADYRGLTNANLEVLRGRLREHGARFSIVKNTLARRAAEEAAVEPLLALLEGPSAIAFVRSGGDAMAVAKALSDSARETKLLTLRGGVLEGVSISGADVESLAKLPPMDVLRSQVVGVIIAPLTQLLGLLSAPLRDLVGLIDARITQLGDGDEPPAVTTAPEAVVEDVVVDAPAESAEPVADTTEDANETEAANEKEEE
ncbi:MAG: 50S ribosomal protein L10 [Gaiellaceae bacterium]